nr:hypothetical protein [Klebsiella variicola]
MSNEAMKMALAKQLTIALQNLALRGSKLRTGMVTLLITGSKTSAGQHPKKILQIVPATDVLQWVKTLGRQS